MWESTLLLLVLVRPPFVHAPAFSGLWGSPTFTSEAPPIRTSTPIVILGKFARAQKLKMAMRGGGHSWVGFPLCDGSLLRDLGRLNQR